VTKQQTAAAAMDVEGNDDDNSVLCQKRRCTRSDIDSANSLRAANPLCFFCDLPADEELLHSVTTFEVDRRVKECALVLSDNRSVTTFEVDRRVKECALVLSACQACCG